MLWFSGISLCSSGQLVSQNLLLSIANEDFGRTLLQSDNSITRKERRKLSGPIRDIPGPILVPDCQYISSCRSRLTELKQGCTPADSLANGLWLGEVTPQLQNLIFTEKMLIARVKHNH